MHTVHLVSLLSVGSFFSLIWILEAKSLAKGIARNMIPTSGDTTIITVIVSLAGAKGAGTGAGSKSWSCSENCNLMFVRSVPLIGENKKKTTL